MSRGRKRNSNVLDVDLSEVFKKNVGLYLDIICKSRSYDDRAVSNFENLKKIAREAKNQFLKNKQVRLNNVKPKDEILEMRYDIPSHWNWFLLSDVAFYQEGPGIRSFQYKAEGIKLLNVQNITPDKLQLDLTSRYISCEEFKLKYKHFKVEKGDILFASSGGSWGKTCWFEDPGYDLVLNTSTMRLKTFSESVLANDFLYLFLKTDFFRKQLIVQLSGMQPNFGSTHLNSVSIPLPPVNEQKKILAFLHDLGNNSLAKHEYFETKVEKKLIALQVAQLKCSEILNEIANQSKNIGLLRQTILQEAVQGKLTKQDKNDEPPSQLLKRIKDEKQKLIEEGKLKKEKELPPITEDEIPFQLPNNWAWCRLGNLCIKIGSGSTPRGGREVYTKQGVKFIRSQNVYNEGLVFENVAYIDEATHNKMSGTKVIANDLLLNITGGSIGRCALVPLDFDEANVNQHVTIIRTVSLVKREFIHQIIISPYFQDYIMATQTGGNREGLAKKNMELMLVPLPPLLEQQRIVAKVQQLQQHLNSLETQMQQSRQYANELSQAVLKEAFTKVSNHRLIQAH